VFLEPCLIEPWRPVADLAAPVTNREFTLARWGALGGVGDRLRMERLRLSKSRVKQDAVGDIDQMIIDVAC
jgi:hypothetical protein